MVSNSSIVEEYYSLARDYCDRACQHFQTLPERTVRRALADLAYYVVECHR